MKRKGNRRSLISGYEYDLGTLVGKIKSDEDARSKAFKLHHFKLLHDNKFISRLIIDLSGYRSNIHPP